MEHLLGVTLVQNQGQGVGFKQRTRTDLVSKQISACPVPRPPALGHRAPGGEPVQKQPSRGGGRGQGFPNKPVLPSTWLPSSPC